jgi:predicted ATPase
MPVAAVSVAGYRSIQHLRLPVGPLTVLVGKNGVGKTNLYRALELLHAAADGSITRCIAEDGGAESVLWAGAQRNGELVNLTFMVEIDTLEYRIEIGLPMLAELALCLEQGVKEEELRLRAGNKSTVLMRRQGPDAWLLDADGARRDYARALLPSETALASFRDVDRYPALEYVRRELNGWRFFHTFRTEPGAAVRGSCLALATPMLRADGTDLAAVLATLYYVQGDAVAVERAVDEALPGAKLMVDVDKGRASFALKFPDQPRAFGAHEISDGTLRYLCLVGALCSYRLPAFIALNEPETSLHPDLMPALAGLIARASKRTRIWVVTHSKVLANEISRLTGVRPGSVTKRRGATWIDGLAPTSPMADERDRLQA